tara:strand:- start:1033 stop:2259 length:1227 start_codon:yes stop_codon:yes gene_type:complete
MTMRVYARAATRCWTGHERKASRALARIGGRGRIPPRDRSSGCRGSDPGGMQRPGRKTKERDQMYQPDSHRYDRMTYRRCGRSGLKLPAISLGLWHNFGHDTPHQTKRDICRKAFDLGITHFDLANNYGPPPGSAEEAFGEIRRQDFAGLRDQMIVSSKAGYPMWDGPYGDWGSRKSLIASCDQSLRRMGLDYVDIFYSHRFDPDTPLEETMGALDHIVRSGRALYAGISSYNSQRTAEAAAILKDLGTPCVIHQPSYNMLNRWIENDGLLETLDDLGIGSIVFTPLAQGMLTKKYLNGIPQDSRAAQGKSLSQDWLSDDMIRRLRGLNDLAAERGQSLAQMAVAWVLRGGRVTSALIGASRPSQVEDCVGALQNTDFTEAELARIDDLSAGGDVNIWARSSEGAGEE